jgi:hypothetical protein
MTSGRVGPRRRCLVLLAAAAALAAVAGTHAQDQQPALTPTDARAVRSVIDAQLAAFAAGDAERAFSYASPGIRAQFSNAATFMAMVEDSYPMVVRPTAVSYFQPQRSNGMVLQRLQLRDGEGRSWLASYQLARQAKAGWRIEGCVVVPDSGGAST